MNLRLLNDWADALEALGKLDWEARGFNMRWWAKRQLPTSPELGCGTVCCAYGVGTTLPSWIEAGLGLQQQLPDLGSLAPLAYPNPAPWVSLGTSLAPLFYPTPRPWVTLGISEDDWSWLTKATGYDLPASPNDVAERIRSLTTW